MTLAEILHTIVSAINVGDELAGTLHEAIDALKHSLEPAVPPAGTPAAPPAK
jgi:hypothetical protein